MRKLTIQTMTAHAVLLVACLLVIGCTGSAPVRNSSEPVVSVIHVVSHGWHAGIVIRRADIPEDVWPEKRDFPDAEYLEIGWGDRDYYQTRDPGLFTTLKAALWPTDSVLHVAAFRGSVAVFFPRQKIVTLPVSRGGLDRLLAHIETSFDRPGHAPLAALGTGLYGDSRFYAARDAFYVFSNCNRWVARGLRRAGYGIHDVITVDGLFSQLEGLEAAGTASR